MVNKYNGLTRKKPTNIPDVVMGMLEMVEAMDSVLRVPHHLHSDCWVVEVVGFVDVGRLVEGGAHQVQAMELAMDYLAMVYLVRGTVMKQ